MVGILHLPEKQIGGISFKFSIKGDLQNDINKNAYYIFRNSKLFVMNQKEAYNLVHILRREKLRKINNLSNL